MAANKKDFRELIKTAEKAGWKVEQGRKHMKWKPPSGPFIISACSPSDDRAILNHRSLLRKAGLPV